MIYKFGITIGILFILTTNLFGRSCSSHDYDKVEYFAEQAAEKFVHKQYHGGDNVVVTVKDCKYNGYAKKYKSEIKIKWVGNMDSSNHYYVYGEFSIKDSGNDAEFKTTSENSTARDYRQEMGWAAAIIGTTIVLGSMSASN